jgi:c-di-GMP-related signal transduction protein
MKLDLESILNEWKEDCLIPQHQLDETSRNTPNLHAKYLQYLSLTKLQLKRAENAQKSLLKDKWLYYNGKMDVSVLKEKGWEPDPFDGLKILKGELDYYYNSDPEIQKSEEKIIYLKTIIDTLVEIVDSLKWRHQTISNIIKWRQFDAGA